MRFGVIGSTRDFGSLCLSSNLKASVMFHISCYNPIFIKYFISEAAFNPLTGVKTGLNLIQVKKITHALLQNKNVTIKSKLIDEKGHAILWRVYYGFDSLDSTILLDIILIKDKQPCE